METLRIAILSDIHGNSIALEAVLADIQTQGGVDEYWLLGDYAAIGYDPINVLKRLSTLPKASFIRGNTDRYVVTGERPVPHLGEVRADLSLLPTYVQLEASFSWTAGALAASGWLPWLANLPLEMSVQLPDGTEVLAVHAAPGTDDGDGIHLGTTDNELRGLVGASNARLFLVGHTHSPFDRSVDDKRVVNPGSISNTHPPDLRAGYAFLVADRKQYSIELRRVEFDHLAVIEATERANHPAAVYISRYMRGEHRPAWLSSKILANLASNPRPKVNS